MTAPAVRARNIQDMASIFFSLIASAGGLVYYFKVVDVSQDDVTFIVKILNT